MIINGDENKSLLIDILNAKIQEEHINVGNKSMFNDIFNKVCDYYQKNKFKYGGDIKEINKIIISECYMILIDENKKQQRQHMNNSNQIRPSAKAQIPLIDISDKFSIDKPYDTNKEKHQKINEFNNSYKQRLKEFNDTMGEKKPNEIDFSFKADETLNNENMEYMLKQKIKEREMMDSGITHKKELPKKVTFSDNVMIKEIQPNNSKIKILDKLKKKNTINESSVNDFPLHQILKTLNTVLKNQDKILEYISSMENKLVKSSQLSE